MLIAQAKSRQFCLLNSLIHMSRQLIIGNQSRRLFTNQIQVVFKGGYSLYYINEKLNSKAESSWATRLLAFPWAVIHLSPLHNRGGSSVTTHTQKRKQTQTIVSFTAAKRKVFLLYKWNIEQHIQCNPASELWGCRMYPYMVLSSKG